LMCSKRRMFRWRSRLKTRMQLCSIETRPLTSSNLKLGSRMRKLERLIRQKKYISMIIVTWMIKLKVSKRSSMNPSKSHLTSCNSLKTWNWSITTWSRSYSFSWNYLSPRLLNFMISLQLRTGSILARNTTVLTQSSQDISTLILRKTRWKSCSSGTQKESTRLARRRSLSRLKVEIRSRSELVVVICTSKISLNSTLPVRLKRSNGMVPVV